MTTCFGWEYIDHTTRKMFLITIATENHIFTLALPAGEERTAEAFELVRAWALSIAFIPAANVSLTQIQELLDQYETIFHVPANALHRPKLRIF